MREASAQLVPLRLSRATQFLLLLSLAVLILRLVDVVTVVAHRSERPEVFEALGGPQRVAEHLRAIDEHQVDAARLYRKLGGLLGSCQHLHGAHASGDLERVRNAAAKVPQSSRIRLSVHVGELAASATCT